MSNANCIPDIQTPKFNKHNFQYGKRILPNLLSKCERRQDAPNNEDWLLEDWKDHYSAVWFHQDSSDEQDLSLW